MICRTTGFAVYFDATVGEEPSPLCHSFDSDFIAEINAGLAESTVIRTTTGVIAKAHIVSFNIICLGNCNIVYHVTQYSVYLNRFRSISFLRKTVNYSQFRSRRLISLKSHIAIHYTCHPRSPERTELHCQRLWLPRWKSSKNCKEFCFFYVFRWYEYVYYWDIGE